MTNGVPVTDTGLAGDFDGDDDVDGNDFLLWQTGGSPNGATAGDLGVWQSHFGEVASAPAVSAVPEPSTLLLLGCGMLGLAGRQRARSMRIFAP